MPECVKLLRKKHKRRKLSNTVTIDSIYEKNFLSLNSVLEAVIVDVFVLPGSLSFGKVWCNLMCCYNSVVDIASLFVLGTNIYMLSLGDFWSTNTIDLYLHRR